MTVHWLGMSDNLNITQESTFLAFVGAYFVRMMSLQGLANMDNRVKSFVCMGLRVRFIDIAELLKELSKKRMWAVKRAIQNKMCGLVHDILISEKHRGEYSICNLSKEYSQVPLKAHKNAYLGLNYLHHGQINCRSIDLSRRPRKNYEDRELDLPDQAFDCLVEWLSSELPGFIQTEFQTKKDEDQSREIEMLRDELAKKEQEKRELEIKLAKLQNKENQPKKPKKLPKLPKRTKKEFNFHIDNQRHENENKFYHLNTGGITPIYKSKSINKQQLSKKNERIMRKRLTQAVNTFHSKSMKKPNLRVVQGQTIPQNMARTGVKNGNDLSVGRKNLNSSGVVKSSCNLI